MRFLLVCMLMPLAAIAAPKKKSGPFTLTSSSFKDGAAISKAFTPDGENHSPGLAWSGLPKKAKSIALIVDDPDAGKDPWVHWVFYGLSSEVPRLAEGMPVDETVKLGTAATLTQGKNSFNTIGWRGPNPPPGKLHHYVFTLFALDRDLALAPGKTKAELLDAMEGHILGQAVYKGTYQR